MGVPEPSYGDWSALAFPNCKCFRQTVLYCAVFIDVTEQLVFCDISHGQTVSIRRSQLTPTTCANYVYAMEQFSRLSRLSFPVMHVISSIPLIWDCCVTRCFRLKLPSRSCNNSTPCCTHGQWKPWWPQSTTYRFRPYFCGVSL